MFKIEEVFFYMVVNHYRHLGWGKNEEIRNRRVLHKQETKRGKSNVQKVDGDC